jgi:hypothetical protein
LLDDVEDAAAEALFDTGCPEDGCGSGRAGDVVDACAGTPDTSATATAVALRIDAHLRRTLTCQH